MGVAFDIWEVALEVDVADPLELVAVTVTLRYWLTSKEARV